MADLLKFIHEDADTIIAELKADLETRLNRQLAPADVEMLLVQALAYREMLLRANINDAARQNLVAFSRGAALEYIGELVGVYRLPAASAACTIQFTLVNGHTGVQISEGLRVQSTDGKAIFRTIEAVVVNPGTLTVNVNAKCSTAGKIGNGYTSNKINIILDPQPYLTAAQNTDTSSGGADEELDEDLRERIKLAPASFSVAGPVDAYIFFAKSASSAIVDVAVTSPVPGQVNIYPLLENGALPTQAILDAVLAICNGDKCRPLTDTVIVDSPTIQNYAINVQLTLLTKAVNTNADTTVLQALTAWKDSRKNRLGLDVVRNKIASMAMLDGVVYNVNVVSPAADIVATPEVYTNCTGITVTIIGTADE
ncbi:baseplate assembly protein [Foetidibacter luteolus]|uniref:baseplate assembly protein n=1 Tax=Foetidibacter luteolus TaxID=2608880 RepID=UPI00129BBB97|nr:baseplate J/gp47 family protein [Foetidibacter luteolus]